MTRRGSLEHFIELRARALGFRHMGITTPEPSEHVDAYRAWIDRERHGEMSYLARPESVHRRADLRGTFESVRSVVVLAHEYGKGDDGGAADPGRPVVARYARGADYHQVVGALLDRLLEEIRAEYAARTPGVPVPDGRSYVDTGPILERDLARRAGLGWFGRNTMLIHPRTGSYFVLGVLLLDLELRVSAPFEADRCGQCTACLGACPTGALLGRNDDGAPVMDARRCIAYLTIELRGAIPEELRPAIGNRVFGCDICQEVCPWNVRFPAEDPPPAYAPRDDLDGARLAELTERILVMSGKEYLRVFRDSPLARPRRAGMLRNLCVGLGNYGATSPAAAAEARPVLERAAGDRSELVREHARWALDRLAVAPG